MAERSHKGLCYAKVNDDLWSLYVFELVQTGRQTAGWTMKTLVTCVGRQPLSSTWVLGAKRSSEQLRKLNSIARATVLLVSIA